MKKADRILMAALLLGSLAFGACPAWAQTYGIFREYYAGFGGTTIPDLTNNPAFPNNPTATNIITDYFDAPHDFADNYGTRLRAFVLPPIPGNYFLWVSSDDQGVLYLSPDENPANKVQIALQTSWNGWREWTRDPQQKSGPIMLEGGRRYYLEALQKEEGGGDNLSVGWQLADGSQELPIPASRCLPFTGVVTSRPNLLAQPTNTTIFEGRSATLRVLASDRAPLKYQWQQSGTNIPGATNAVFTTPALSTNNSGAQYRCILSNSLGSTTSQVATVTVVVDTIAPTISAAQSMGLGAVRVIFSEPVELASATNLTNYFITNNLPITSAVPGGDAQSVVLYTGPLALGVTYTLTVNNVRDLAPRSNVIAPNSRATFVAMVAGIYREVFTDLGGYVLADLTNSVNYPTNPTYAVLVTDYFEAPHDFSDNYGTRMRALIAPPVSGTYTFWIASDDQSVLYLSPDEDPARKTLIANVSGWTGYREWTREANQQSSPLLLTAGRRYYLEALQKEGTGGDNLSVRWQLPSGTMEEPIPAHRCVPVGMIPPTIAAPPTNLTVMEGTPAVFTVQPVNRDLLAYQWQRNGANISGATNNAYTIPYAALSDHNARFRCVLTNALGLTNTAEAVLAVTPDPIPPTILAVQNVGAGTVWLTFSERMDPATATNPANYFITNDVGILAAAFGLEQQNIILTTTPLVFGGNYTVVVNNVRDQAATPNRIAANSLAPFVATEFASWGVGKPVLPGSQIQVPGGADVSGGGAGIGGAADQFQFSFQQRTGDFDFQVRLHDLGLSDVWAKAGLMARETLDPASRFAAVLATPTLVGAFFEARNATGGGTALSGNFPLNYPNLWLRLQRAGNTFNGYASFDGQTWTPLGATALALPNTIWFGPAVSSHYTNQSATARFRELAATTNTATGAAPGSVEPLGPSSRRTSIVISEIMYHPALRLDGRRLEYIELFNGQPFFEDLSGWRISGDADFTFPRGTILPAGAFLVVARNPADVQAVYGITNVVGPFTNNLPGQTGTVRLRSDIDAVLLEVNYFSDPPWPVAADGAGHSLVLARPSYGENDPRAWAASDRIGGSPGRMDGVSFEPAQAVVINEFQARSVPPEQDFIELYNHGNTPVDLSGCYLSDDPDVCKFRLPAGTVIAPREYVVFQESQLGFVLNAGGETIYFVNASQTRVLDAVRYRSQARGITTGRYPDGAPQFYPLALKSPGASNGPPRVGEIVINEIMCDPISGDDEDQYVELYNRGTNTVELGNWRFSAGINFTFPLNTSMAPGSFLVVARNVPRMLAHHPGLNPALVLGPFSQSLKGRGERLALSAIERELVFTNNVVVTNTTFFVEDEVTYATAGRWDIWAKGGGSSLELIDPRANHRLAPNWANSDESGKAPWTNIEVTAQVYSDGNGNFSNDRLFIVLLGEGECLVDNVEVYVAGNAANLVLNPAFESGTNNWVFLGSHDSSFWETSQGYQSSRCLHVRATTDGDTGPNCIRGALAQTIPTGSTVTIRAKVRWLRGWPEILFRLRGNWLEAAGRLAVPANLGTPGARNSRAVTNAGPAITDVTHRPVLPAVNQPVVVTARVEDPDGLASVTVLYRIDPGTSLVAVTMLDNGASGDAVAGDGVFSATIPGQASGTLIAFRIRATDALGAAAQFPNDAPARECLARFGEALPLSSFGAYRFWMTQATLDRWSNREKLSNEPLDVTFVYGQARVVYNAGALYSGSVWHAGGLNSPTGNGCNYKVVIPDDDPVLGAGDLNKLHGPGNSWDDDAAQREKTSFWIAAQLGLPISQQRFINLFVNGQRRYAIFEDLQVPNGDVLKEYFPNDDDGDLLKVMFWYEFADDALNFTAAAGASLQNFLTPAGNKETARYRWTFQKRAVVDSALNYTNLFNLVDAVNVQGANYTAAVEGLADVEQWMRIAAFQHIIGNWDCWLTGGGQNLYLYKPRNDKWKMLIWDVNIGLGIGGYSDGPTTDLFKVGDSPIARMYAHPPWCRAYWRALQDAVNGPLMDSTVGPLMEARYAAFAANGLAVNPPTAIKTWITLRRNYIISQLAAVAAPFAITSPVPNYSTSNQFITISGTAPVGVKDLKINGIAYPVTWTTITNWTMTYPLGPGTNMLQAQGCDRLGNVLTNTSLSVNFTGAIYRPQDYVCLSEIMFKPAVSNAGFVEVFNRATTVSFDLSNWRLDGVDFTFAPGTLLSPASSLVVVKDPIVFAATYGATPRIAGQFDGKLKEQGEILTLIKPGFAPLPDEVVDRVKYEAAAPWPESANGGGYSLQLIDPAQDHRRVANWFGGATSAWTRFTTNGLVNGTNFYLYLDSAGDVYLDDLALVPLSGPLAGSNVLQNGDFELALTNGWSFLGTNLLTSDIVTNPVHSGHGSLHLISTQPGAATRTLFQGLPAGVVNATNTLSFWYRLGNNASNLFLRTYPGSNLRPQVNLQPGLRHTPAASNVTGVTLPLLLPLWLNEAQPHNVNGPRDNAGERDPWLEIFNPSTNSVSLAGCFLTDDYGALTNWPFPADAVIGAGQFLIVWCDGHPEQSTTNALHTRFRLNSTTGSVALVQTQLSRTYVLDYLNYPWLGADRSFGSLPDGQPIDRQVLFYATPGASNNPASAPITVAINEWMADNAGFLADPADGNFDDWFELYNYGANEVNLAGYYLTDNLSNRFQFAAPAGYLIPPGGFLLVWADNESSQNSPDQPDLHVNFQLSKRGEAIGLYAPDGAAIDTVIFPVQSENISQGCYPDGQPPISLLAVPTPRAANLFATPRPPALAAVADQVLTAGQVLTITNVASDSNAPPQQLRYLLVSAPTGVTLDAANGVLAWRPVIGQSPAIHVITIAVVHDGGLGLGATQIFNVRVERPAAPAFAPPLFTNGQFNLLINGVTGPDYSILTSANLTNWTLLFQSNAPLLPFRFVDPGPTNLSRRFYRVLIGP